mmetsp:Transcript_5319/g.14894  ORF Transcript_5319/g.14894 Transcript_5319/m.14894 type:complete len:215 (-) Transcript_5319:86-730(-)
MHGYSAALNGEERQASMSEQTAKQSPLRRAVLGFAVVGALAVAGALAVRSAGLAVAPPTPGGAHSLQLNAVGKKEDPKAEKSFHEGVWGKALNTEEFAAAMGKFLNPPKEEDMKPAYEKILSTLTAMNFEAGVMALAESKIPNLVNMLTPGKTYQNLMVANILIELANDSTVRKVAIENAGALPKCRAILVAGGDKFLPEGRVVTELYTVLHTR